jgi:hypothetical protein
MSIEVEKIGLWCHRSDFLQMVAACTGLLPHHSLMACMIIRFPVQDKSFDARERLLNQEGTEGKIASALT